MPEAETLAVGSRRPDRAPTPWLFLTSGVLVGALLGAMAAFLVVQAQQPDRAAEFMIDQRLKAYQAYADEVATANTLEDKAMAAVVSDLDAEDGDGPDPTGAKPEALAQERLRLDARMRDVDLLGSEPVRTAFRDNHQEQDEAWLLCSRCTTATMRPRPTTIAPCRERSWRCAGSGHRRRWCW